MSKSPPDARSQATAEAAMRAVSGGKQEMPEVDFATFALSLATSALVHLGEQPDGEGPAEVNLPLAKQTIDMMAMLQGKTRGNLSAEESRLMDSLLYDLRMRYVEKAK